MSLTVLINLGLTIKIHYQMPLIGDLSFQFMKFLFSVPQSYSLHEIIFLGPYLSHVKRSLYFVSPLGDRSANQLSLQRVAPFLR